MHILQLSYDKYSCFKRLQKHKIFQHFSVVLLAESGTRFLQKISSRFDFGCGLAFRSRLDFSLESISAPRYASIIGFRNPINRILEPKFSPKNEI